MSRLKNWMSSEAYVSDSPWSWTLTSRTHPSYKTTSTTAGIYDSAATVDNKRKSFNHSSDNNHNIVLINADLQSNHLERNNYHCAFTQDSTSNKLCTQWHMSKSRASMSYVYLYILHSSQKHGYIHKEKWCIKHHIDTIIKSKQNCLTL